MKGPPILRRAFFKTSKMKSIEKKIRIQKFDSDFNMLEDRLIGQDRELTRGPEEKHMGPLKLEVCLFEQEDVDNFITYIKRLQSDLPLEEKLPKIKKALAEPGNFRLSIIDAIKGLEDGSKLNDLLAEHGFIPIALGFLQDAGYNVKVDPVHRGYDFWVRLLKKAKNPINNSYDASLLIGIGKKRIVAYDGTEKVLNLELEGENALTIKVPKLVKLKLPDHLIPEERNRFRIEIEALENDPGLEPSKFYRRWIWDVKKINPQDLVLPRIDVIPNPYN